jgi:prevent-host-death family protein
MKIPSSQVRINLTDLMARVIQGNETIEITKYGDVSVVMISAEKYDRLMRTMMHDDVEVTETP